MGYPVNLQVRGRLCVVVGGGAVAERKVATLIDFNADVRVISPKLTSGLKDLVAKGKVEHIGKRYSFGDLSQAFLAIAASDSGKVNALVYEEAVEKRILVNVVDQPELCTFTLPSVVKHGELVIGVSTSGAYPLLARKIAQQIAEEFGPEHEDYLVVLRRFRQIAKGLVEVERRSVLEEFLEHDPRYVIERGDDASLLKEIARITAKKRKSDRS